MKKRRVDLLTKEEIEAEKQAKKRAKETKIDTTRLALLYCRQSTKKQTVRNKESALSQTVGAKKRATEEYGFLEDHLILFIENALDRWGNKLDEDRWRSVSGTLATIFRPGLREVERYIESDQAGALFVDDVSRLFRDEIGITSRQFVETCKAHNCVIVTEDATYDFNATARDDRKAFLEECDEAAQYLDFVRRTMHRRREKKAIRGGYIGHAIPTGFVLNDDKEYEPNEEWAPVVARLTRRFRELGADLSALHNEIRGLPIFPDLSPEMAERVGLVRLRRVPGGFTVASRQSLIWMLINPANAGHKVYDGQIVKWNSHPALVNIDDYNYARAHLARADLEGNKIVQPQRAKRFTQGSQKRDGLLDGVRIDGRPVVTSNQGSVYVFRQKGFEAYTIKNNADLTGDPYSGSISLSVVDDAVSKRLEEKMNMLVFHAVVEQELGGSSEYGAQAILSHVASLKQRIQGDLPQIDKLITAAEKAIALEERDYSVASDVMNTEDIRKHYTSLDRLHKLLSDHEAKRAQINRTDQDIEKVSSRLNRASEEWPDMDLEDRRSFIRLITYNITLDALSDRFMKLTIEWSPVLAGDNYIESAIFFRGNGAGSNWQPQEDAILRRMYPRSSRRDVLMELPHRSWQSIRSRAVTLSIARYTRRPEQSTALTSTSLKDSELMEEFGITREEVEAGCRVWWRVDGTIKSDVVALPTIAKLKQSAARIAATSARGASEVSGSNHWKRSMVCK